MVPGFGATKHGEPSGLGFRAVGHSDHRFIYSVDTQTPAWTQLTSTLGILVFRYTEVMQDVQARDLAYVRWTPYP